MYSRSTLYFTAGREEENGPDSQEDADSTHRLTLLGLRAMEGKQKGQRLVSKQVVNGHLLPCHAQPACPQLTRGLHFLPG